MVKSSAIKILRPKHERVDLRFVFELMRLINFPLGDHKRYYISEYQHVELTVPDYEEQAAIANVLSDMDAEIAALQTKLLKDRQLKQGMMHTAPKSGSMGYVYLPYAIDCIIPK